MGLLLGIFIGAVATVAFALCLLSVRSVALRWVLATFIPAISIALFYWAPVWSNGDEGEYGSWSTFFMGMWYLPCYFVAVLFVYTTRHRYGIRKNIEQSGEAAEAAFSKREMLGVWSAPMVAVIYTGLINADTGWDWVGVALSIYFITAIIGMPSYLLFRRMHWLRLHQLILLGAYLGLILALWYVPLTPSAFSACEWRSTVWDIASPSLAAALIGATHWLIAMARRPGIS